jgi:peroxiredoxin
MPRTESNTIELGTLVPEFTLPGKNGLDVGPHSVEVKPALLVAFISNRCPFVILIREELARIGRDYAGRGLAILAVNSNDPKAHPEETGARVAAEAAEQGYSFPYLKDEDGRVPGVGV